MNVPLLLRNHLNVFSDCYSNLMNFQRNYYSFEDYFRALVKSTEKKLFLDYENVFEFRNRVLIEWSHNVHASPPADASRGCKNIPETAITLI